MDLINGDALVFLSIGGNQVAFITRQTIFHRSADRLHFRHVL
jgi:hypothetical protein